MKKIGITQRVQEIEEYGEYRDAIDQRLLNFITNLGCQPYPVPNTFFPNKSDIHESACRIRQLGLLLQMFEY